MNNGPWIILVAAACILGSAITMIYIPRTVADDTQEEPVIKDITGICEVCGLVQPWAEVKRIKFCECNRVIAVADCPLEIVDIVYDEPEIDPELKATILDIIKAQVRFMLSQGYTLDPNAADEGRIEFVADKDILHTGEEADEDFVFDQTTISDHLSNDFYEDLSLAIIGKNK